MDIQEIWQALGLREDKTGYKGVYATGDFDELEDYGAGLLEVAIFYVPFKKGIQVSFSLSTIDDGCWQAWDTQEYTSLKEAKTRIEEIKKLFDSKMMNFKKLPNAKTLNEWLRKVNLYGIYTG